MIASKSRIVWSVVGAAVLLGLATVAAGAVVGYLEASGSPVVLAGPLVWMAVLLAVAVMIGSIWIGAMWMRSIDEAAREAHKAAWYWGGSAGMAVGGVLLILTALPGAARIQFPSFLPDRVDPAAYAASGAFAIMGLMLLGYGVVWAWWWLARR